MFPAWRSASGVMTDYLSCQQLQRGPLSPSGCDESFQAVAAGNESNNALHTTTTHSLTMTCNIAQRKHVPVTARLCNVVHASTARIVWRCSSPYPCDEMQFIEINFRYIIHGIDWQLYKLYKLDRALYSLYELCRMCNEVNIAKECQINKKNN